VTPQELTDLQHSLANVWSGADRLDAEAVADHLSDLGWVGLRAAPPARPAQDPLPLASTRRLPKRASA
jgi:hypothetical protein